MSNAVLSDALFTALTITFITQFLLMIKKPSAFQLVLQAIIVALAFTIRYTAAYYPLISLTGLLLSQYRPSLKVLGVSLCALLIIPFYIYTVNKTKEITGTAQFSVFGGWQLANNALYMYDKITVDNNELPATTRELDKVSKAFYAKFHPSTGELFALPGTYFIKVPYAILKPYLNVRYSYTNPPGEFKYWGMVSPAYNAYGKWLITHYPLPFAKYYLWPNTKNYFLPYLEKFGSYNLDLNTVPIQVQDWFDYIVPNVQAASASLQGKIFYIFPVIFMTLNLYFAVTLLLLLPRKKYRALSSGMKRGLILISVFLLINFGFSIFATPVVLRYQVIPFIILLTYSLLLSETRKKHDKPSLQLL